MLRKMRSLVEARGRTFSDTWPPPRGRGDDQFHRAYSDCSGMVSSAMGRKLRSSLQELHIAVLGMNGSGKSALTVKYITRRFITEYDPVLEDTYCKHEMVGSQEVMVWVMDTVEGCEKEQSRFVSWADVFLVVYSITSSASFDAARRLLAALAEHDHSFCPRPHSTYLLGNKTDLHRYRQVSKTEGARLAEEMKAHFFELNTTEEQQVEVKSVFQHAISNTLTARSQLTYRSPSPKSGYGASDSEAASASAAPVVLRSKTSLSSVRRSKSPGLKSPHSLHSASLPPPPIAPPKKNSALSLFKIFNQ